MIVEGSPVSPDLGGKEYMEPEITFLRKDDALIHLRDKNPMIVIVRCDYWKIKCVLIDYGSSADILYYDAFEGLHLNLDDLKSFQHQLVGFSGKHVQLKGYITLKSLFGTEEKQIWSR